jgi:hypothetical protein
MLRKSLCAVVLFSATSAAIGEGAPSSTPAISSPMKCETGPAKRSFGGTAWLVYSCTDGASMVVVSDTGNPAMPFVFVLNNRAGGYTISGEGTGDKRASDAAGDVLAHMSATEFGTLLAETKRPVR